MMDFDVDFAIWMVVIGCTRISFYSWNRLEINFETESTNHEDGKKKTTFPTQV